MNPRSAFPVVVVAAEIACVAILWALLFKLNGVMFKALEFSQHVSWIFLPAALRVLAVLLFRWRGAVGLFLGALLTSSQSLQSLAPYPWIAAALSAVAPLFAVEIAKHHLRISSDLQGLSFQKLALVCSAGAAVSALAHSLLYSHQTGDRAAMWGFFPMFAGDLVGTVVVVYTAHFCLRLWFPASPKS